MRQAEPVPARLRNEVPLSDRLEVALADGMALLALTIDERAIILAALEDPPQELAELRAVLLNEHAWRQSTGLDP